MHLICRRWRARVPCAPSKRCCRRVTTTVQSTYLTGAVPREHGIVANGWYFRDECEIKFWRQSNHLVQARRSGTRRERRDPAFTCANLFWWYTMYSQRDYTVTPRPMYPADGRKLPDVYTHPPALRDELQRELGAVPAVPLLGPGRRHRLAAHGSPTRAARRRRDIDPTLTLVYLPHLDYVLQRFGPERSAASPRRTCASSTPCAGQLIDHFERAARDVIVLSEYGITPVSRPGAPQPRAARGRAADACAKSWAASCSTPARARRSPSPTTRSRTCT